MFCFWLRTGQSLPVKDLEEFWLFDPIKLPPVVIDADGINNLIEYPDWWRLLKDEAILTPMPVKWPVAR